jgi:hypothetical protein
LPTTIKVLSVGKRVARTTKPKARLGNVDGRRLRSRCADIGLKSDKQDIATAFYAKRVNPKVVLAPNYNVAPSTFLPVVRLEKATAN